MAARAPFARWLHSWQERVVVLFGLAAFVLVVYLVVVLGGGALVGRTDSPDLTLSVLATVIVALGFEPVQHRLEAAVHRRLGHPPSPYDVLTLFSATVAGEYPADQLPERMARVLAEGTSARWAQVWLAVGDRLVPAATWPPSATGAAGAGLPPEPRDGALDATAPGRRALPVRHAGDLLGVLRLQEGDRSVLTPVEERLFAGLAAQAGLALRSARLQAELAQRLAELADRAAQLRASRERLVQTQDDERRRLERDIHDGAQQHLVALAVNLRLAQTLASSAPARATTQLRAQAQAAAETIDTLVALSSGMYPRLLDEEGLVPALRAAAVTSPVDVRIDAEELARQPRQVEAALYFCCLEALQNAAKHAGAGRVDVRLERTGLDGAVLRLTVHDDGAGFDPAVASAGAGLSNMRDRLDAVGGQVSVESRPGAGTTMTATVAAADLVPAQRGS
jgi:signal transduction histidine kinase